MDNNKQPSAADIIDKSMQRIAIGVFMVSLSYASSALIFFVGEGLGSYLSMAKLGFGILAVVIVFPQFIKKIRLMMRARPDCAEPEGFVVDVFKRAAEKGFAFTFVFLVFMDFLTGKSFADLPAEFVVELILSVSLAIFALSFFFFNRAGEDDEFDAESGTGFDQ